MAETELRPAHTQKHQSSSSGHVNALSGKLCVLISSYAGVILSHASQNGARQCEAMTGPAWSKEHAQQHDRTNIGGAKGSKTRVKMLRMNAHT
jgi:hypothetical protein